jgi:hypothetical protein
MYRILGSRHAAPTPTYGTYDPSPVVSSRICLASPNDQAGTSTSLGPADKNSGASKPRARWISDGIPAFFSRPSISSAEVSSGAAATCTQLSSMSEFYPSAYFTEAPGRRGVLRSSQPASSTEPDLPWPPPRFVEGILCEARSLLLSPQDLLSFRIVLPIWKAVVQRYNMTRFSAASMGGV